MKKTFSDVAPKKDDFFSIMAFFLYISLLFVFGCILKFPE